MFKKLISLVFGDKKTKLKKNIDKKYKSAIEFQRNGNIRKYSLLMSEIQELEDEYSKL